MIFHHVLSSSPVTKGMTLLSRYPPEVGSLLCHKVSQLLERHFGAAEGNKKNENLIYVRNKSVCVVYEIYVYICILYMYIYICVHIQVHK